MKKMYCYNCDKDVNPNIINQVNTYTVHKCEVKVFEEVFECPFCKSELINDNLDKSLYNLQQTSANLVLTTKNTTGFTEGLNKQSNVLINCLLKNLNCVVCNINKIVVGLGETLSKKFGGLRLFFGKPVP